MKIHFLSDIHLEQHHWRKAWDLSSIECDVHVLAGDIGVGLQGIEFALTLPRPVIYVFGNHEYYGQRTLAELWEKAREKVAGSHVHLLENNSVTVGDTNFLGCTLWTDFAILGEDQQTQMMRYARSVMNDYGYILVDRKRPAIYDRLDPIPSVKGTKLTPGMVLERHRASRRFLAENLAAPAPGLRTVVVTHHAPHAKSLPCGEAVSRADAAYASDLGELVAQADLWIHGHVHEIRDYVLDTGGRVVCNCRGYRDSGVNAVEGFMWNKVVEL
jgi:predicted phosphodiesterase